MLTFFANELGMGMEVFQEPFYGIQFEIPDDAYYETNDGWPWGVKFGRDEKHKQIPPYAGPV